MLLQNKTIYAQYPINFSAGATGNERSQKGQRGVTNANKYIGFAGIPMSSGVPNGYGVHYGYGKRIKIIGFTPDNTFYTSMSITNGAVGKGIINLAQITGLKRMVAVINGLAIFDADIEGIGKIVSNLVGVASVNANMAALVAMVANLPGTANITAALSLISSAVCQILAGAMIDGDMIGVVPLSADIYNTSSLEGDITGNTYIFAAILANAIINGDLEGEGNMSAEVVMGTPIEELSPTTLATAVWNALANEYNESGTMGEKLNDAGSASNPWTEVIEGYYTASDLLKLISSILLGKTTIIDLGGGLANVKFRDVNDSVDRVEADMDESERTNITLHP